jgi:hypothetical protein
MFTFSSQRVPLYLNHATSPVPASSNVAGGFPHSNGLSPLLREICKPGSAWEDEIKRGHAYSVRRQRESAPKARLCASTTASPIVVDSHLKKSNRHHKIVRQFHVK